MRNVAPDAARLAAFLAGLSPESRRWFNPHGYDFAAAREVCHRTREPSRGAWLLTRPDAPGGVGADTLGYGFLIGLGSRYPELGIVIRDDARDRGLGRLLMRYLIAVARTRGATGVQLTVYDDNPRALHLYRSLGFTTRGRILAGLRTRRIALLMRLTLR